MHKIKFLLNPFVIIKGRLLRAVVLHNHKLQILIGSLLDQGTHAHIQIRGMILIGNDD